MGKRIRACMPLMKMAPSPDGSFRVGRVLSRGAVRRKLFCEEYLRAHGPDHDIDLERLAQVQDPLEGLTLRRVDSQWLLGPRASIKYDAWSYKAMGLLKDHRCQITHTHLDALAEALEPQYGIYNDHWERILHVPIDLTRPVEEQLEGLGPRLTEMREYLYSLTKKKPPRTRGRTVWRDIYILLLVDLLNRNDAQAADQAFPGEPTVRARRLVRQALTRAREAVLVLGLGHLIPPTE